MEARRWLSPPAVEQEEFFPDLVSYEHMKLDEAKNEIISQVELLLDYIDPPDAEDRLWSMAEQYSIISRLKQLIEELHAAGVSGSRS